MKLSKILKWAGRRLREPSTYTGAAMIAAAVGAPQIGLQIDKAGQIAMLILGSGLAAATTKHHPPIADLV